MDAHQKISIGIFGALLLGTMAMYSMGGLSSSALNANTLVNENDRCSETSMKEYAASYASDKAKIGEIQEFVEKNCGGEIVASKKSYCEARTKQIETYSARVKKYEQCQGGVTVK